MEEAKLHTLEQIKAFLDGASEVAFRVPKEDRIPFIERVYAAHLKFNQADQIRLVFSV